MLGKKKESTIDIDSLIGENIKIIGKIEGSGNLRIDGLVEGDIDYKGDIIIGETGKVKGNISCSNVSLTGKVEGNIKLKSKLTILPKGKLIGDAEVANLIIHENAYFDGNCKMIGNNTSGDKITTESQQKNK
ncbi:MAG: polymer-forming cytoskeletal protein [Tissierellia bacterium]|nr:polymer-forming cytoskeletal protein [Tissierellia bacterium]